MTGSRSSDHVEEKVQLGILKIREKKTSNFNGADVMWLHHWVDKYLVPYIDKLKRGQAGQQMLK